MPEVLAFSIVILLFSVIVHEVMHGLVALKFGDTTAQRAGRLTLNPIPHIDPIGTVLLPGLFLFSSVISGGSFGPFIAWAKPVPVNPLNFKDLRRGELMVSAAGVLANFGLAIIAALLFHIFGSMSPVVARLLIFTVTINLMLGFFNLLPIPPLDGSKVLLSQLPYNLAREYQKLERYGFIILLLLVFMPSSPLFSILSGLVGFFTQILLGL